MTIEVSECLIAFGTILSKSRTPKRVKNWPFLGSRIWPQTHHFWVFGHWIREGGRWSAIGGSPPTPGPPIAGPAPPKGSPPPREEGDLNEWVTGRVTPERPRPRPPEKKVTSFLRLGVLSTCAALPEVKRQVLQCSIPESRRELSSDRQWSGFRYLSLCLMPERAA